MELLRNKTRRRRMVLFSIKIIIYLFFLTKRYVLNRFIHCWLSLSLSVRHARAGVLVS